MRAKNLIYGRHPVLEALKADTALEKIILLRTANSPEVKELLQLARGQNVPVQKVPVQKLDSIVRGNHQGVIAFRALIPYYELEDVLPMLYDQGKTPLFLLLDRITDVRNFGAIARTAELAGVNAIVVPTSGGALINAEAMKASTGALNIIPVCKTNSLEDAINFLSLNGIPVFAAALGGSKKLFELDLTIPVAVLLGSEGEGISNSLLKLCGERFEIPMQGTIDSYNVSVSAGMILYETMRQRLLVK